MYYLSCEEYYSDEDWDAYLEIKNYYIDIKEEKC